MRRHLHSGFTLLELSIVIVIIALITGAILVGESMIRASQLRGAVSEMQKYTQAIGDFQDKYHALPGDFSGATALWGAANADPTTCWTTVGSGTQTCDGNGDGHVGDRGFGTAADIGEGYRAWQHLANAGFIGGSFNGVVGPASPFDDVIGTNVPASALTSAGYVLVWSSTDLNMSASMRNHHSFQFAADDHGSSSYRNSSLDAPILTTQESLQLDTKMDDGLAGSGLVQSWTHVSMAPNCTTDGTNYDLTQAGLQCVMLFGLGF